MFPVIFNQPSEMAFPKNIRIIFHFGIIMVVHAFLVSSNQTVDWRYNACKPRSCGNGPTISYPFQIIEDGGNIDFCGYPGFEVKCENRTPIYSTSLSKYIIEDISFENQSFRLVHTDVMHLSSSCRVPSRNFSFDRSLFDFGPNIVDLHLFYNCSNEIREKYTLNPIACLSNSNFTLYNSFAVLNTGKDDVNSEMLCESYVIEPVELAGGRPNQTVEGLDYLQLLENGFTLRWSGLRCGVCKKSGGHCGDSHRKPVCFCTDGVHHKDCHDETSNTKVIISTATVAIVLGIVIVITFFCFRRKFTLGGKYVLLWWKKTEKDQNIENFLKNYGSLAPKRYLYSDVKKMTNSFKAKLGQGGYGHVYKGRLCNGNLVAVKILNGSKGNGEDFINEVASISRTSHVNIVNLVGFCFEGHKRALVYEFMPNGSLEKFIYDGSSLTDRQLGWGKLYQIAVGIARGLEYLHRGCNTRILHFDIKPHNILLDEDFCPKIADFGLAKLCLGKESILSMVTARGTIGYIAPEVFCRSFGGVSYKSDVYSYGMMVSEMVGGRKNIDVEVVRTSEIYFPHWIYKQLESNNELGLHGIVNEEENEIARKMVIVSLWCIQTDPVTRPSMTRVLEMLQGSLESLQIPPKPYLSSPSRSPAGS